jgi:hypothetical protein
VNAAWVLVFALNGEAKRTEAMGAEACVLHMLARPASQAPYCIDGSGHRMIRPADCQTVKGWSNWCRRDD